MGLLDITDDPQSMGLLSLGLRLMSTPGKFGQALGTAGLGSLQDLQQAQQLAQQKKTQAMQQQMQALQLQQAQQAQQRQQALQELAQRMARTPTQQAMMANGGPTNAAAAAIPNTAPGFDYAGYAQGLAGLGDPMGALTMQQALQKDDTPVKLAPGEQLFSGKATGYKPLAKAAPKEDDFVANMRASGVDPASPQGQALLQQWLQKQASHTPPVNVSVSMDKGFGQAFATDAAKDLGGSRDKARASANTLQTLDRIDQALKSGNVVTGPGATPELFMRQLGEKIGIGGKDNAETLKRTRDLIQGSAALAVDGAAMLAGQGQITENERALVVKAASVGADLTVPEIQQLSGVLRKINRAKIEQHQSMLSKVDKQFAPFVPFYQVDMPPGQGDVDALVRKYTGK